MYRHAIRTAIACALTLGFYQVLGTADRAGTVWAVVSAVIVMQANLGSSYVASRNRLIGTAIGALTGTLFLHFFGSGLVSLTAGVALTLLLCSVLTLQDTLRMAGATVVIVMLSIHAESRLWEFGVARFLNIATGIAMALATQLVVWPARATVGLRKGVIEAINNLGQYFNAVTTAIEKGNYDREAVDALRLSVRESLRKDQQLENDASSEPLSKHPEHDRLIDILRRLEELHRHTLALDYTARVMPGDTFYQRLEPSLGKLIAVCGLTFPWLARSVDSPTQEPPPDVEASLAGVDAAYARLRELRATREYGTEEVLRFCTFIFTLRAIARELSCLAGRVIPEDSIDEPSE